jgi:hypothetical protein
MDSIDDDRIVPDHPEFYRVSGLHPDTVARRDKQIAADPEIDPLWPRPIQISAKRKGRRLRDILRWMNRDQSTPTAADAYADLAEISTGDDRQSPEQSNIDPGWREAAEEYHRNKPATRLVPTKVTPTRQGPVTTRSPGNPASGADKPRRRGGLGRIRPSRAGVSITNGRPSRAVAHLKQGDDYDERTEAQKDRS